MLKNLQKGKTDEEFEKEWLRARQQEEFFDKLKAQGKIVIRGNVPTGPTGNAVDIKRLPMKEYDENGYEIKNPQLKPEVVEENAQKFKDLYGN